eukprot:823421_1
MSSWFWLNATTNPPHWHPLGTEASEFIQQQHGNTEPFYLPKSIDNEHQRCRIRLLPDVTTSMAIDCDTSHPLICIPTSEQNRLWFGFPTQSTATKQTEIKSQAIANQINIDLCTQKIIFSNQTAEQKQKETNALPEHKWYCLGIDPIKNRWYPMDTFTNHQMDQHHYSNTQDVFKLDHTTEACSLNMRFGDNAFHVDIPYGFLSVIEDDAEEEKQNSNGHQNEELLVIRSTFDVDGLIHGLHVSLSPFNPDLNTRISSTRTQNDCIKLCRILYRLLDQEADKE